jgi:hypothetical protein
LRYNQPPESVPSRPRGKQPARHLSVPTRARDKRHVQLLFNTRPCLFLHTQTRCLRHAKLVHPIQVDVAESVKARSGNRRPPEHATI